MNYDNWKLQAADNDGDVTSCCGAYEEVKERYDVDRDLEVKVMVNGHRYNVSEWFK